MKLPGFIRNWDEDQRDTAVKITGLVVAAFTIFTLISTVSYLFHWEEDMSLLGAADAAKVDVGNAAGLLGYKFGKLLVCDYLGLGSFALLVILAAVSVRLLFGKWPYSLLKTTLMAVTGAIIASVAFAFAGSLCGMDLAFGGGLGGQFGGGAVAWAFGLFKPVVTGVFIAVLIACWLLFSSKPFLRKVSALFSKKEKAPKEPKEKKRARRKAKEEEEEDDDEIPVVPEVEDFVGDAIMEAEEPAPAPVKTRPAKKEPAPQQQEGGFEVITDESLDAEVKKLPRIDNRLDPPDGLPRFKSPDITLLVNHASGKREVTQEELTRNNNKIRATLANYKIQIDNVKALVGATVTLYKVYPAPGVKITEIKRLQEDIAMSLSAKGVRVVTLSDSVGIEVANDHPSIVPLRSLLNDDAFRESKADLPVAIGYTITQEVKVFDLADAPHLLVAGATKQGKSVGLNVIVSSLLYAKHPSELKFVFIDPKMVEFSAYGRLLKHYLAVLPEAASEEEEMSAAIVKKPKDAEKILRSLCVEMDDRYELLSKAGVNKISAYNDKYRDRHLLPTEGHRYLPFLVVVVDEYADLTMTLGGSPESKAASRSISTSIIRLAQKGRAAGIHVILATQRPSVDVISGLIKTNFPMRIAFRVASRVDSMTILDSPGAEKLIGKGDMLFSAGIDTERVQCGYVSMEEIEELTEYIGGQEGYGKSYNTPYYLPIPPDNNGDGGGSGADVKDLDERFEEAANLVVSMQKASTSFLQTNLGMGYAKSARVMGQLEAAGIVGPQDGAKPRQVLVSDPESLRSILDSLGK